MTFRPARSWRCRAWCCGGTAGPSGTPPAASRASSTRRWTRWAASRPPSPRRISSRPGCRRRSTVVVSSDLSRAVETAAALTDAARRAVATGRPAARARDGLLGGADPRRGGRAVPRPVRGLDRRPSGAGRGGEEPAAVGERALAALVDLPPARVAVVVTHGGTAGRLIERLLGLGPDHRRVFGPLANCAWSELAVQGGAGGCCGTTLGAAAAGADREPGGTPGRRRATRRRAAPSGPAAGTGRPPPSPRCHRVLATQRRAG